MRAGRLRHRVELHSATTTRNSYGEAVDTWASYASVWAGIEPLRSDEITNAQQVQAEITHKVIIRYNSSVAETHRVIYGTRTLEIVSIINMNEQNIYQELMCKEVA